ncbi:MAG: SMP-30/gluconolactonase/LRE family protein [Pseudomonadales bacterium]|nr:SMP-30/gluconolactonase/LRE family protein [Pseudomonadales bacterium]
MFTDSKGTGLLLCGVLLCGVLLAAGCGGPDSAPPPAANGPVAEETVVAADSCADEGKLSYLCGLMNAEDILPLGDTALLLASGMSSGDITGHLYLINPNDDSWQELIFGGALSASLDSQAYPNCPGLLNLSQFSMHGLSLREYETNRFDLYVTSHGEREGIEIFDLDVSSAAPALSWKGCVVMPEPQNTFFINSVAILADGGFVTTKMMDPAGGGFAAVGAGEITGEVYEWHPGGPVSAVPGTELSGANGIVLSEDERFMYVAAFGGREVLKFDRSQNPPGKQSVAVDIAPDNIRWGVNGKLLTAGNNYVAPSTCSGQACASGWSVLEIDPETLTATRVGGADQTVAIQGVSTALEVDGNLWVGTFNGDRVAYFPKQ